MTNQVDENQTKDGTMKRKSLDGFKVSDDPSFTRPLRIAHEEGRLHPDIARELGLETGDHPCPVCGMLHWSIEEGAGCCIADFPYSGLDRLEAIEKMPKRGGDAYAGVLYPDEFTGAIENLMETYRCRTSVALAHRTGMSGIFVERALAGTVAWIGHRNWDILMNEFGGDVPGCEKYPFCCV